MTIRCLFCIMLHRDIPRTVVRTAAFCFPILPISCCNKAYIRVRYGLYWPLKWAISQAEMVHIAMRENIP